MIFFRKTKTYTHSKHKYLVYVFTLYLALCISIIISLYLAQSYILWMPIFSMIYMHTMKTESIKRDSTVFKTKTADLNENNKRALFGVIAILI